MVAKRKRDDSGGALPQSPEHPGQQSDSEVEPGTTSSGHSIHDPSDRPPSGGGDASHKQEHQVDARAELEFSDRRIQLVRKKICQYEKKLKPALKVACRFEHQKLVKRLRRSQSADQDDVKGKPVDVSKIKDEMEELKNIDHASAAARHVRRLLIRSKPIHTRLKQAVPDIFDDIPLSEPSPALANVLARLFNANAVKAVTTDLLIMMASICGVELDGVVLPKRKNQAGVDVAPAVQQPPRDRAGAKPGPTVVPLPQTAKAGIQKGSPSSESEWAPDWASEAEDDDRLADDEIADGSDDEVDRDECDGSDVEMEDEERTISRIDGLTFDDGDSDDSDDSDREGFARPSRRRSDPVSDSDTGSSSSSAPASKTKKKKKTKAKDSTKLSAGMEPVTTKSTSAFIPSLSMNGYMSNSDTPSWEYNSDGDATGKTDKKHKNRRGQRARRAIWERKYGSSAKHVVRERAEAAADRNAGWDMRRGAQLADEGGGGAAGGSARGRDKWKRDGRNDRTDRDGFRKPGRGPGQGSGPRSGPDGGHVHPDRKTRFGADHRPNQTHVDGPPPAKKSKLPDRAEMHPSWLAKRDAKERQKQIATAVMAGGAAANKRIVFD